MRMWDSSTANRVDRYIGISHHITKRIKKIYNRNAEVIYPPVDTDFFTPGAGKGDYYLTVSRMFPYKKIDLIVAAFSEMPEKKLVVIGEGPDFQKIKTVAKKNIEFLGHQPSHVIKEYMQKARAFVFAAEEDFGIVTVEAQACGTPVIAFGRGGSLETVIPLKQSEIISPESTKSPTGVYFQEQTSEALRGAIAFFEKNQNAFDIHQIRRNAIRFSTERFKREFAGFIDEARKQHGDTKSLN